MCITFIECIKALTKSTKFSISVTLDLREIENETWHK